MTEQRSESGPVLGRVQQTLVNEAIATAEDLAEAITQFLGWHGYDNAEGLADALARHPAYATEAANRIKERRS